MKHGPHFSHQQDLPLEYQILNISVNLDRISQWLMDGYMERKGLIDKFLEQTNSYVNDLLSQDISKQFQPTLKRFYQEFSDLEKQVANEKEKIYWAERASTWANILQHRAKLA